MVAGMGGLEGRAGGAGETFRGQLWRGSDGSEKLENIAKEIIGVEM